MNLSKADIFHFITHFLLRWENSAVTVGELRTELNNWSKHKNVSYHGKLNQHWDFFFFLQLFSHNFLFNFNKEHVYKGEKKVSPACFEAQRWINLCSTYSALAYLGDRSNIEKVGALFEGKITLFTLHLCCLLRFWKSVPLRERRSLLLTQPYFWESMRAWLCVCVLEMKGIFITRVNCH